MKILLIQASGYRENGRLDRRKSRWLLGMTLPYVAALTPGDIRVEIKDDMLEEITFREDCDLVGLTFMSHQAPRPGTKVQKQLLAAGRIFDHDWSHYSGFQVVYHPKHMTARQLEEGYWRANRRFYSPLSMLKRYRRA